MSTLAQTVVLPQRCTVVLTLNDAAATSKRLAAAASLATTTHYISLPRAADALVQVDVAVSADASTAWINVLSKVPSSASIEFGLAVRELLAKTQASALFMYAGARFQTVHDAAHVVDIGRGSGAAVAADAPKLDVHNTKIHDTLLTVLVELAVLEAHAVHSRFVVVPLALVASFADAQAAGEMCAKTVAESVRNVHGLDVGVVVPRADEVDIVKGLRALVIDAAIAGQGGVEGSSSNSRRHMDGLYV
ncbi:hypothetical protein BC831DRAFT_458096 [Entophlyctis helioformis]|nr:hypothetical protein BC831DRAFT_458096 [Entophlyctis helioformis]